MSVNPFAAPSAPTAQIAYAVQFSSPRPGVVADTAEVQDFISAVSTVRMPFGILAAKDISTSDKNVKLPSASGDVSNPAGFVVRTGAIESTRDGLAPAYQAGDPINIMRAGRIWTACEEAVTADTAVYARITANGALSQLGALRNDTDGGKATLVPGARWIDSAAAGAPARIEFNFMGL